MFDARSSELASFGRMLSRRDQTPCCEILHRHFAALCPDARTASVACEHRVLDRRVDLNQSGLAMAGSVIGSADLP